jgi:aminopeptidase N
MKKIVAVLFLMAFDSGCRGNGSMEAQNPAMGIPLTLATTRAQTIEDVRYHLSFDIPATASESVTGREVIHFKLRTVPEFVVLDFAPGADFLSSVSVGDKPSQFRVVNGHIVIPEKELTAGENAVEIDFRAGDASLNRNEEFLYTLFVPARAHLAFPCFDQPDLKARYTLELTIPSGWESVANGAELSREPSGGRTRVSFTETPPLPTYLFAFATGKFQVETAQRNGRTFRMFHRETDAKKVARNREAVFDLHASSLKWLEDYTAIPYPFGKFDFILIPSFQFSGMEHPGAILYNAASLLLDESATENQMLNRATTIAHETAHMWFGDLVTMRWFNDVWMKEVFASFLAGKIVNPQYPRVNHDLRFLISNYPSAYAVDRTGGSHSIRQELENLNEAGSLYDEIIYQKAPIVMRQLERVLGAQRLQEGLRVYLKQFQFGNATWVDLVKLLDERTELDLAAWSHAWVEEGRRPSIRTEIERNSKGRAQRVAFVQSDPQEGRSLRWTQQMVVLLGTSAETQEIALDLQGEQVEVAAANALPRVDFVLPTGGGLAYGDFTLDDQSRSFLLKHLSDLKDPVARGAAWVTLWEELLDHRVRPGDFLDVAIDALPQESIEQNVQLVLAYVREAFWTFLNPSARQALAPRLEETLRAGLSRSSSSTMKSTYFSAFRSVVTTPDGIAFLERVWRRQERIPGLTLAEPDEATMALELAVRSVPAAASILEEQRGRFMNPDRKARFEFVMPALSDRQEIRDKFFESLKDVKNRAHEPWVIEGVRFLNHPLKARDSEKYIRPALELLRDIQRTGDIFFPRDWMDATLSSHNTRAAADTVRAFLSEQKDYPVRLRRTVLRSADDVFRAAEIVGE